MQKLGLNEIREMFQKFFEGKGHLRLPSFSLVPQNDPSILLINAGMTPLKPYFTGMEAPPCKRAVTCQKCLRTADIENVGKTARHGTFFEMLGNFSFGDYFKKEAIAWAWEFSTEVLRLPVDRLCVSIYHDDDEAFDIWNRDIGVPAGKIVRLGKKDNFWEHGTGPCGPCSEIYYDRGADKGCKKPGCAVGCDCDRYIEFWNLVFTQFNKDENGNYTLLDRKNIDTGMGLERIALIMQEVNSLFEVDTIGSILKHICKIAGREYGKSEKSDISIRIITDHLRGTVMMAADGILPSNEGRGYVLRRLLRRAARHGKLLGIDRPFLFEAAGVVIGESGSAYPELLEKADYIKKVIKMEEEKFDSTVDQGLAILNEYIQKTGPGNLIDRWTAFKLHDTYGFPLDLTREIAQENGFTVDEQGFTVLMEEQKNKAREDFKNKQGSAWGEDTFSKLDNSKGTEFTGYDAPETYSRILHILKAGEIVQAAQEGDNIVIVLEKTSFYAESGGQTGDIGSIKSVDGLVKIDNCRKTAGGIHLHIGTVEKGIIEKDSIACAEIDKRRRLSTARNHTATHLLHKALKNIAGDHVNQAGSLVESDRLRFDFTHFSPLTNEELKKIENEVNGRIIECIPVHTEEMSLEEAGKRGATALFGEKYGLTVRVVSIGNYSMELCGGTHLDNTSQVGFMKITSESGIAAGVRRIEALTGECALEYFSEKELMLKEIASVLKTNPQDTLKRVEMLLADMKNMSRELEQLRNKLVSSSIEETLSRAVEVKGIKVLTARFDQLDTETLRNTGDILKNRLGSGVVVLASGYDGKVSLIVMATKDVLGKGIHSGNIIREIAVITGGGGGGRPDMAQAGGKDISKIDDALKHAFKAVESQLR